MPHSAGNYPGPVDGPGGGAMLTDPASGPARLRARAGVLRTLRTEQCAKSQCVPRQPGRARVSVLRTGWRTYHQNPSGRLRAGRIKPAEEAMPLPRPALMRGHEAAALGRRIHILYGEF